MAGFVTRRKKWLQCISKRCKDSFSVRGTLSTEMVIIVILITGTCYDFVTKYFLLVLGKQLSHPATKSTRQIARVHIHVKRAIERLKIFQGNLPLSLADQMLIVSGGLCNLLKPLAR